MTDYDVIICGLGPVGQLLALLLGDRGVHTLAFDRRPEPYLLPRAAISDSNAAAAVGTAPKHRIDRRQGATVFFSMMSMIRPGRESQNMRRTHATASDRPGSV